MSLTFDTITVNGSGVRFAYTDSGAPPSPSRPSRSAPYITIIAIHGMCFSASIFKKAQAAAPQKGLRFVALNRRNYPGSTPLTKEETEVVLNGGSKEARYAWMKDRGHELGLFIDKLIDKEGIPPISADGRTGGVALLAWSAGAGYLNAMISHADALPPSVQARLSSHIRAFIFQEPHNVEFGFPISEGEYSPLVDPTIPPEHRNAMFCHWVTSYFDHPGTTTNNSALSTKAKDLKSLSWVVPSTARIGTLYNMSKDEQDEIICNGKEVQIEVPFFMNFAEERKIVYRKAWYDEEESMKRIFGGRVRVSHVVGGMAPAFAFASLWNVEKDAKEMGKTINVKIVPQANHFMHWDDPEKALDVYLECA